MKAIERGISEAKTAVINQGGELFPLRGDNAQTWGEGEAIWVNSIADLKRGRPIFEATPISRLDPKATGNGRA